MTMTLAERVKRAREFAGLTQAQLAERIEQLFGKRGITQQGISKIESGVESSGSTVQIAAACDVDPIWLASGAGREPRLGAAEPNAHYFKPNAENRREVSILLDALLPPESHPVPTHTRLEIVDEVLTSLTPEGKPDMNVLLTLVEETKEKFGGGKL